MDRSCHLQRRNFPPARCGFYQAKELFGLSLLPTDGLAYTPLARGLYKRGRIIIYPSRDHTDTSLRPPFMNLTLAQEAQAIKPKPLGEVTWWCRGENGSEEHSAPAPAPRLCEAVTSRHLPTRQRHRPQPSPARSTDPLRLLSLTEQQMEMGKPGYVIPSFFSFLFRSRAPGFLQLPVKSQASQFKIISDW